MPSEVAVRSLTNRGDRSTKVFAHNLYPSTFVIILAARRRMAAVRPHKPGPQAPEMFTRMQVFVDAPESPAKLGPFLFSVGDLRQSFPVTTFHRPPGTSTSSYRTRARPPKRTDFFSTRGAGRPGFSEKQPNGTEVKYWQRCLIRNGLDAVKGDPQQLRTGRSS